jgi:hypothetical protein
VIQIEELKAELRHLNEQLGELRGEVAREYLPRTEVNRRRRHALALVAVAIAGSLLVNNATITRCFLGPPTGVERRLCGWAFPGFERARQQNDVRLAQFRGLLEAIPANTARSQANERRVTELERQVKQLQRQRR